MAAFPDPRLSPLLHKVVPLRFMGFPLEIALSQALFSSHDIDSGTRLLLKALAKEFTEGRLGTPETALDIGCGTGVIGLALAAAFPALRVSAQDRDALALDFSRANAEANGLSGRFSLRSGLLLDIGPDERFDLIFTNIPAKAGAPALEDFFFRAPAFLRPGGSVWTVIVDSLSRAAVSSILRAGHELFLDLAGKEHAVLAFRPKEGASPMPPPAERLSPYDRGRFPFALCDIEYAIKAVHGVEDFDIPSYALRLDAHILSKLSLSARLPSRGGGHAPRVLVWGCGQGHLPLILSRLLPGAAIHLAGRDLLELLASERNLAEAAAPPPASLLHCGGPWGLTGALGPSSLDMAIIHPDLVSGYEWSADFLPVMGELLSPGGLLVMQSESSAMSVLDRRKAKGFVPLLDKREKGRRALCWTRASA